MIAVRYRYNELYRQLLPTEPFRPYIPVRLEHRGHMFDTLGLIDSGADTALFNSDILQVLGLNLADGRLAPTQGVGGTIDVFRFDIYLAAQGRRFPASVGFSPSWPRQFGLLGRDDFFSAFQVGFDQSNRRVLLNTFPTP